MTHRKWLEQSSTKIALTQIQTHYMPTSLVASQNCMPTFLVASQHYMPTFLVLPEASTLFVGTSKTICRFGGIAGRLSTLE